MKKVDDDGEEKQKLISIFSSPQSLDLESGVGTFRCKTCGKWFPSFQALGGHRSSHNRSPCRSKRALDLDLGKLVPAKRKKMKTAVHVCRVCGLKFSVGQALGGHMRRHGRKEKKSNNVGSLVTEDNAVMDSITGSSCSRSSNNNNNDGDSRDGINRSSSNNGLCLELRLSPPDFDVGMLNLRLGLGF